MTHPAIPSPAGAAHEPDRPWWKHGMVWLVISGPAVVVVAGLVTAFIAIRGADTLVTDPPPRGRVAVGADTPAQQGRNHAATPAR